MDGQRFDALTRSLASARSRRAVGQGFAALAVGGGLVLNDASPTSARKRKNKKKKPNKKKPCPQGSTRCGKSCMATARDDANCGGCGVRCNESDNCCDGHCHDLMTDRQHCGECGNACASGEACCGGRCRDTSRDAQNCGECGVACAANEVCVAGACLPCDVCAEGCPATFVQEAVNAADPGDTIQLCPGVYAGAVTIRKDLTLIGSGRDDDGSVLTDAGHNEIALFVDEGVTVELKDLAVAGNPESISLAGIVNLGNLTLTQCSVRGHQYSNVGGGISNGATGTLTLERTIVSGNRVGHSAGKGGGIFNAGGGTVTLLSSDVRDNLAGESGGGIHNEPLGVVTLIDSTVSENEAIVRGGGVANYGDLTLRNSVVRNNQGGGLFNFGSVSLEGTSRVTGNTPTNCQGTPVCAP